MALWTDLVDPAELTGYARAAFEDYDVQQSSLRPFLPNTTIPDIVGEVQQGVSGMVDAADYRSFDAETSIGSGPGGGSLVFKLAPLGRKERINEYDQLRARNADSGDNVLTAVRRVTVRRVKAVADRIELARGQALYTGAITINENGFSASANFNRPGGNTVTAGTLWSNPAASILTDLDTWTSYYLAQNGQLPGAFVTSKRVVTNLLRNTEMKTMMQINGGATPNIITPASINAILSQYGYPPIVTYDRQIKVAGSLVRPFPDTAFMMLPAPAATADGTDLGATFFGQTLEASEPEYGLGGEDRPGIVVGLWKERDPIGIWVHSAAIALPALANSSLSFVATVL